MEKIYNQAITILNKLKREDTATKQSDVWHKTIITDGYFSKKTVSNVSGATTSLGEIDRVLIPFSDKFKPYKEWRQSGQQDGFYTMSNGDYVINAMVTEAVTPANITAIIKSYGDDVCTVRVVKEHSKRVTSQNVQLAIEGV